MFFGFAGAVVEGRGMLVMVVDGEYSDGHETGRVNVEPEVNG